MSLTEGSAHLLWRLQEGVEGKHCEISITVYAHSTEETSKHLLR